MQLQYTLQLLVIESTANDVETLLNELRQGGYGIKSRHVLESAELETAMREEEWDLILCARDVESLALADVIDHTSHLESDIPIILIYDPAKDDPNKCVVDAMMAGAADAVPNTSPEHLQFVMSRELANLQERRTARQWRIGMDEREKRWRALLEASRDPIAYTHGGMHMHANPTYLDMFGYELEELEGLPILDLVAPDDQQKMKEFIRAEGKDKDIREVEVVGLRADGNRLDIKMEISPTLYDGEECWQVVIRDQSHSKEIHEQLENLKFRDPLTGLFNRNYFMQQLETAISESHEDRSAQMLLYVELDNSNVLRETVGIAAMDALIVEVGNQFDYHIAPGHLLSRFGENVFTLLIDPENVRDAVEVAERLRMSLDNDIIEVEGQSVSTTCSIGICHSLKDARGAEAVLAEAQQTCRVAKRKGGNRVEVHMRSVETQRSEKADTSRLGEAVAEAFDQGAFTLVYQPIVNLHADAQEHYEVSLQLEHDGEVVPQSLIFGAQIKADLVAKIDGWLMDQVVDVLSQRKSEGRDTHLFVKLSEQALVDEKMVLAIGKRLRSAKVSGNQLILQISEAAAVSQVKSVKAFVKGLNELNCMTALEGFGTGLNALTTLKHLPVDFLKVDPSLIQTLIKDAESQSGIRAIVEMANKLDKRAVASGVEDASTLAMLWDLGVHYAQGDGIQGASSVLEWDFDPDEEIIG